MISYDIEVTWRSGGRTFMLPATVCYTDDEGPDSTELRMEAVRMAVTEHIPSDFPDDIEGAQFIGATVSGVDL